MPDFKKQLLINAVINQIRLDLALGDETAIDELLGNLNEDVMLAFVDDEVADAIYPE